MKKELKKFFMSIALTILVLASFFTKGFYTVLVIGGIVIAIYNIMLLSKKSFKDRLEEKVEKDNFYKNNPIIAYLEILCFFVEHEKNKLKQRFYNRKEIIEIPNCDGICAASAENPNKRLVKFFWTDFYNYEPEGIPKYGYWFPIIGEEAFTNRVNYLFKIIKKLMSEREKTFSDFEIVTILYYYYKICLTIRNNFSCKIYEKITEANIVDFNAVGICYNICLLFVDRNVENMRARAIIIENKPKWYSTFYWNKNYNKKLAKLYYWKKGEKGNMQRLKFLEHLCKKYK